MPPRGGKALSETWQSLYLGNPVRWRINKGKIVLIAPREEPGSAGPVGHLLLACQDSECGWKWWVVLEIQPCVGGDVFTPENSRLASATAAMGTGMGVVAVHSGCRKKV